MARGYLWAINKEGFGKLTLFLKQNLGSHFAPDQRNSQRAIYANLMDMRGHLYSLYAICIDAF